MSTKVAAMGLAAALMAGTAVLGVTAAFALPRDRVRSCADSGGEWDAYRIDGVQYYECIWVYGDGQYAISIMNGRGVEIGACVGDRYSETCR
jgi:hypothetical protein